MIRTITAAALMVLALAGCSAAQPVSVAQTIAATSSSTAAAPSSTPAATTTPSLWSKSEAGRRYLAMIGPANRALDALRAAATSGKLARITAACKAQAAAEDAFMRQLDAGDWPANVRPAVDALVTELGEGRAPLLACARASSYVDADAALGEYGATNTGAAQRIRVRLGLPGVA